MVRTPLLLSLPGSCVGTLVGELRSHKLCGTAKKKKLKKMSIHGYIPVEPHHRFVYDFKR